MNRIAYYLQSIYKLISRLVKPFHYPYCIYIENAGFNNCGDQLMIHAIVEQIQKYLPSSRILLSKNAYDQNPTYCNKKGILPLFLCGGAVRTFLFHFIYDRILNDHNHITPNQVDLILNARGFCYSDQWKRPASDILAERTFYSCFSKVGRRIVFLPQAFGPFELETSKALIQQAYSFADLVFARDQQSFSFVQSAVGECEKMSLVQDFTILVEPSDLASVCLPPHNYIIIIVNCRMQSHTVEAVSLRYKDFILAIINYLQNRGEKIVLLNHEGKEDEMLMRDINKEVGDSCILITNISGVDAKAIIRDSKMVISSRFHGVVSGLVQNVPTLCTSWSHKYQELLADHQCENNMLDSTNIGQALIKIENALNNPLQYVSKAGCNNQLRQNVIKMWDSILSGT